MTRALMLAAVLLIAGCDDMTTQPKVPAYRAAAAGPARVPDGRAEFRAWPQPPPPLDLALIERGQDRYRQFCVPCHSELGDGNGMVVQRGFGPPPSYLEPRLLKAPTRHFYDVITEGYGAMYSFAARVPPRDRWAIAAYIRVLQRAGSGSAADVPSGQGIAEAPP